MTKAEPDDRDMDAQAKELFAALFKMHHDANRVMQTLAGKIVHTDVALEDLANISIALKEAHDMADSMRKKLNVLFDETNKQLGKKWLLRVQQEQDTDPIRTKYTTCTPDVKYGVSPPSPTKDFAAYKQFVTDLGIPEHLQATSESRAVVTFNWPGLIDYLSELAAEGKPLPRGVAADRKYPMFKVRHRSKQGVLE